MSIFCSTASFDIFGEFDIDLTFELTKVLENDDKKFGYYHSIENHEINVDDIDKITIDIRDVSETTITKYQKFDEIRIDFSIDNQTTYITVLK